VFGCLSRVPVANPKYHYFNVDNVYTYDPIVSEWGPLVISQLVRFGNALQKKLEDPNLESKIIYFWTSPAPTVRTNAALLIAAFMLIFRGQTPEQAAAPLSQLARTPCIPFRDASPMPRCAYKLTIAHCLQAIDVATRTGIFDRATFDLDQFDYYSYPGNGDVSSIVPGKIYAFSGPTHNSTESRFVRRFPPAHYIGMFRSFGVRAVVRLNDKCYPAAHFTQQGIAHHELFFTDGTPPPLPIARQFVELVETTPGALAVHCKAGLGRTGSCIAVYLMFHYRFTAAQAIAWIRLCRPGSIIGPQQVCA
jgi:cell division cycle 14